MDLKYSFENLLIFLNFFFFQKELLENIEWNLELNLDSLWVLHTLQNSWLKDDARIFPGLALFKNSVQTQQGKKKNQLFVYNFTMRKFQDFSVTQILREINFEGSRISKNAGFAFFGLWILLIWLFSDLKKWKKS